MKNVKCPLCKSPIVKKNGKRNGHQLYKCMVCKRQFRNSRRISKDEIWLSFLNGKQTASEIAKIVGISERTVYRYINSVEVEWTDMPLSGRHGVIHMDVTYFGRNYGVIIVQESSSGSVLYVRIIGHEHVSDYKDAVSSIIERGYSIDGIVIDGIQQLFSEFREYKVQMCQFHMAAIIRRKLTGHPKLPAAIELRSIVLCLTTSDEDQFRRAFNAWKVKWAAFLKERTVNSVTGEWTYTHRRLRSASQSLEFYMPYLFTYLSVPGMPNTNNKVEGTFTDLKKNLHNHSGLSRGNRKRFIEGFFLEWNKSSMG